MKSNVKYSCENTGALWWEIPILPHQGFDKAGVVDFNTRGFTGEARNQTGTKVMPLVPNTDRWCSRPESSEQTKTFCLFTSAFQYTITKFFKCIFWQSKKRNKQSKS
jgi:hypothetical protein